MQAPDILPGRNYPLGATVYSRGVNFSVYSRSAQSVELLLFDDADGPAPSRVLLLDPARHRTFHFWHAFVPGVRAGQHYAYRAHGPFDPANGHRFDGAKVLLDPYCACAALGRSYDRAAARRPGDNVAHAARSIVVDRRGYDWEGDEPLRRPFKNSLIYELHVGGFTRHPSSEVAEHKRGTYAGLVEKIPYLQSLGVTAVELMPVQQFDRTDAPGGLNYWGYSPMALFAPHRAYSSRQDPLGPVLEFRAMVKALHRADIEVILDVVFNHTAEGTADGPTFGLRGLENSDYYMLDAGNPARYANFSGCGNTLNANSAIVRRMVLDCLRWWVADMHVDGFRFDLASTMARDEDGRTLSNPPLLWDIESDPILASAKIIAEAWDAAGLYQVSSFVGHRWAVWNGRFRDDVRRFLRGDEGVARACAERIGGSRDLFPVAGRDPNRSINFVTCHDGFTLADLVSYEQRHNEANGEQNRDGADDNQSWNCGVEGPTDDPAVRALRLRQMKNHLSLLLLSSGTPMLLMGDEVARTQRGNNNAYCHDSELTWLDWTELERSAELLRFFRGFAAFAQALPVVNRDRFWSEASGRQPPVITWHGVEAGCPDLGPTSHTLAWELRDPDSGDHCYAVVNAWSQPLWFRMPPPLPGRTWRRVVDTSLAAPDDFQPPAAASAVTEPTYLVAPHAVVLLVAIATPA